MGARVQAGYRAMFAKRYGQGLVEATWDFVPIVVRGELWRAASFDPDRAGSALEAIAVSGRSMGKLLGVMKYVSRIMTALDHINALSTREAGLVYAVSRFGADEAKAMLTPGEPDIMTATVRAEMEGTAPALMKRRVREILAEEIPAELQLESKAIAESVNYQNKPKGFAGVLAGLIDRAQGKEDALIPGFPMLKMVSGTAFARFASNMANDYLNYVPPVALFRYWAAGRPGMKASEQYSKIERDMLLGQAAIGGALAALAAAIFLGDDDEGRERAIDINGSFKGLSTEKRQQLLSQGQFPHSIRIGSKQYSYRQFGFGSVLGAIGELRDRQRFMRETWDQESLARKFVDASFAGMFMIRESTAISGLMEFLGFSNAQKYDIDTAVEKSVPKFMARLAGSAVPNLVKEMDAWADPAIFKAETAGEYFMQQVPVGRTTIGPGPILNVLGQPVEVERYPWSRWMKTRKEDAAWSTLGALANKGVFLPVPGSRMIELPNGSRREMNRNETYRYQRAVGARYRRYIVENRAELLRMSKADAMERLDSDTKEIRNEVAEELF
jgi:hypothetical protein